MNYKYCIVCACVWPCVSVCMRAYMCGRVYAYLFMLAMCEWMIILESADFCDELHCSETVGPTRILYLLRRIERRESSDSSCW